MKVPRQSICILTKPQKASAGEGEDTGQSGLRKPLGGAIHGPLVFR